jgi:hypothetical protein
MEVRLKNLHDAACRNIRCIGKYKPYEKYSDRNDLIMKRLLNELIAGEIDIISLKDSERFECLTRSPREGVLVQLSVGWWKDGNVDPSYHVNINSFEDLSREGFPSGIWEIIRRK